MAMEAPYIFKDRSARKKQRSSALAVVFVVVVLSLSLQLLDGNASLPEVASLTLPFLGGKNSKLQAAKKAEEEEQQRQKELEQKQKELEEEEKRKKKAEQEEEQKRQKELEEEEKQKQKEAQEESERKQKEREQKEEDALLKARRKAKRPLNVFEERRVRRQVRSHLTGGSTADGHKAQDWRKPLKPEVKAQMDDAVKFFSETMRVPATLIGSAALGTLFVPHFKWAFYKEEKQSPALLTLWRLYVVLTATTFCAELTCVLGTANAHAQLLELGRNGLSLEPTPMDLIMSHVEFEYLTCGLSFFGGVVAFMSAAFCRVLAVFKYSNSLRMPQEPELCLVVGCMMLGSLFWWLYLVNARLVEFSNIGQMIFRYFQLLVARIRLGQVGFMGFAALCMTLTTVASAIRMVLRPLRGGTVKK